MNSRRAVLLVVALLAVLSSTSSGSATTSPSSTTGGESQSLSGSTSSSVTSSVRPSNTSSVNTWSHSEVSTSTRTSTQSRVRSNTANSHSIVPSPTHKSATTSRSPPTRSLSIVSRRPTGTLSRGTRSAPYSATLTLPSKTRIPSSTPTEVVFQDSFVQVSLSPNPMSTVGFDNGQQFLNFTALPVGTVAWLDELVPFVLQSMVGSQSWNPFAFDQRKESIFHSARTFVMQLPAQSPMQLNPGVSSVLQIIFDRDPCYDCRTDETISFKTAPFLRSVNSFVVVPGGSSSGGVVSWTVREDRYHDSRRIAGLVVSVGMCAYLVANSLLGNPGVSVLVFTEFQLTNIIGRQRCSRGQIAAYFEYSFWVVTPTVQSNGFQDLDPHFGVILVHSLVSILFFVAFVAVARLRKRVRMYFPLVPLGLVYLLFIGGTNSAWLSVAHADLGTAGTAAGSMILWVIFFGTVALTVWRVRSPRGLIFLRYHRGFLSSWLRGTHSPLQLRGKYSIMIDFWDEAVVQFSSPLHLAHLSFSSVVSAFSWNSVNACFPVLGLQLLLQVIASCTIVFTLPGRSPFHNALLVVHSIAHVLIIVSELVALDCQKQRSYAVSEALVILTLVLYFVSAVGQIAASLVERGYRAEAERELKDITAKHRRIVFFQDDLLRMAKMQAAGSNGDAAGVANPGSATAAPHAKATGGSGATDYSAAADERLPSVKYRLIQPKLRDETEAIRRLHTKEFMMPHVRNLGGKMDGDPWSIPRGGSGGRRHGAVVGQGETGRHSPVANSAASRALWTTVEYQPDDPADEFFDAPAGISNIHHSAQRSLPSALHRELSEDDGAAIQNAEGGASPLFFPSPFATGRGVGGGPSVVRSARDRLSSDSEWFVARSVAMAPLASQLLVNPGTTSDDAFTQKRSMGRAEAWPSNAAVPHLGHRWTPTRTSPPSGVGTGTTETVARCPSCSRWIVLEEGCVACGYRRAA